MAYVTAAEVRATATRLLDTDIIADATIDAFIVDATSILNSKLAPAYEVPIADDDAPDELKIAVKYYSSFLAIREAFIDDANNQGASEIAKDYKATARDQIKMLLDGKQRFSSLTAADAGDTKSTLIISSEDSQDNNDLIDCRKDAYVGYLANRFL